MRHISWSLKCTSSKCEFIDHLVMKYIRDVEVGARTGCVFVLVFVCWGGRGRNNVSNHAQCVKNECCNIYESHYIYKRSGKTLHRHKIPCPMFFRNDKVPVVAFFHFIAFCWSPFIAIHNYPNLVGTVQICEILWDKMNKEGITTVLQRIGYTKQ